MPEKADPIGGIIIVRSIGVEERRADDERRQNKRRPKKPGNDSVSISSRARRLAKIETLLADDDAGLAGNKGDGDRSVD